MNYFLREQEKEQWPTQLQWLSNLSLGCRLDIDVARPRDGIQTREMNSRFRGFRYDSKRDILYILTAPLHHSIARPRDIAVNISQNVLKSMSVRNEDGEVETIMFWYPARLAAPQEEPWPFDPPYRRPADI